MEGSALDIFEENAMNAELDALTIRYQGALQERGFINERNLAKQDKQGALLKGLISGGKAMAGPTGFDFGGA